LETQIFIGCWSGQTYREIAPNSSYSEQHIRETATKLFKKLELVLEIKLSKNNFKNPIKHKYKENALTLKNIIIQPLPNNHYITMQNSGNYFFKEWY
jgi:hypothetical protein